MKKCTFSHFSVSLFLFLFSCSYALALEYRKEGLCEGFARVAISSPPGTCVALVADKRQGLRMPRRILEVSAQRFWIIDMGSWDKGRGRLLEMVLDKQQVRMRTLLEGLDRPLALQWGPDKKIYIGEAGTIWRTTLPAPGQAPKRELVIDKLPNTGAHPLKEIAFGAIRGSADSAVFPMYINVGSETDSCRNPAQQQPIPCPESKQSQPRAAIYRALLRVRGGRVLEIKPWAFGLRNSLALTVLPSNRLEDVVLQGENSIDYPEATQPPEEFNMVQEGKHYGWPYCIGAQNLARGYERRFNCKTTQSAAALWPGHVAPLSMVLAPNRTQPSTLANKLLVAWHGFRPAGRRIMAFALDKQGHIVGKGQEIMGDWSEKTGVRPRGAPTGLTFDHAGKLWVVEDHNKTVLLLGSVK